MAPSLFSRSHVDLSDNKPSPTVTDPKMERRSFSSRRSEPLRQPPLDAASRANKGFSRWLSSSSSSSPQRGSKARRTEEEAEKSKTAAEDVGRTSSPAVKARGHLRTRSKALLVSLRSPSPSSSTSTPIPSSSQLQPSFEVVRPSMDVSRRAGSSGRAKDRALADTGTVTQLGEQPAIDSPLAQHPAASPPEAMPRHNRQSSHAPSSLRHRGTLEALTRRMSGLSVSSLTGNHNHNQGGISPDVGVMPAQTGGSFTLRSMRNVRHGSGHVPAESQGSYFAASPGMETSMSDEALMTQSPPLSPTFDDPLALHDFTAPASPTFSSRGMYMDPIGAGSSISVAKFMAGRNRSESGTFHPPDSHGGQPVLRSASPAPVLTLQGSEGAVVQTPAEKLAALEAELARGGRATPMLRQMDELRAARLSLYEDEGVEERGGATGVQQQDRSEPLATPSNSTFAEPSPALQSRPLPGRSLPAASNDTDMHNIPEKDSRFAPRRSLQLSSIFDRLSNAQTTSPPHSPASRSRRYSDKRSLSGEAHRPPLAGPVSPELEHRTRPQRPELTVQPSHTSSSTSSPRGRGMDSASFMTSMSNRFEGGRPKTLLDALSQIESQRRADQTIEPPSQPWVSSTSGDKIQSSGYRASTIFDGPEPAASPKMPLEMGLSSAPPYTPPVSAVEAGMMAQASRATFDPSERLPPSETLPSKISPPGSGDGTSQVAAERPLKLVATGDDVAVPCNEGLTRESLARATGRREGFSSQPSYFDFLASGQKRNPLAKRESAASVGTPILPALPPSNLIVVNASPSESGNEDSDEYVPAQPLAHKETHNAARTRSQPAVITSQTLAPTQEIPSPLPAQPPSLLVVDQSPHAPPDGQQQPSNISSTARGAGRADQPPISVGHAARPARRRSEGSPRTGALPRHDQPLAPPARAATLSAPRRGLSNSSGGSLSRSPSKSAELLSFHAKQARAIAQAQASVGASSSSLALPERSRLGVAPPGIHPNFWATIQPSEREYLQGHHDRAALAARAAYQQAYDSLMGPVLATLPPGAISMNPGGPTGLPTPSPTPTSRSISSAVSAHSPNLVPTLAPGYRYQDTTQPPSGSSKAFGPPPLPSGQHLTHPQHHHAPSGLLNPAGHVRQGSRSSNGHSSRASPNAGNGMAHPIADVTHRPSAKFMNRPAAESTTQPTLLATDAYSRSGNGVDGLAATDSRYRPDGGAFSAASTATSISAAASAAGATSAPAAAPHLTGLDNSTTLTDDLKRSTAAGGREPGEYSATKRDID